MVTCGEFNKTERMPDAWVYAAGAILAAAAVFTCWCGTPLTWDGAYQLAVTLVEQRPFVYETRFHTWLLWRPLVWVSHFTDNVSALVMAYGLPFCLAPVVGLLASWWVVRRHAPGLIVWAAFGIAAAPLPGQIFIINDSIFQQHLFWPVFLGLFVPLTWGQTLMLAGLAVFQFVHPIGAGLLAGAAIAAGIVGCVDVQDRRRMFGRSALMMLLAAAAVAKIVLWPDSYAAAECGWDVALQRWADGVRGAPITGLSMMWVAGACIAAFALLRRGTWPRVLAGVLAAGGLIGGAIVWGGWASDHYAWAKALDYRRWLVPLAGPFYALAFLEAVLAGRSGRAADATAWRLRGVSVVVLCGVFASVLGIQSVIWRGMTQRLMAEVASYPVPVVPPEQVSWIRYTALEHWGTASLVMVMQGPRPTRLALDETNAAKLLERPAKVPLCYFDLRNPEPGRGGWFDCRGIVRELANEPSGGSGVLPGSPPPAHP